MEFVRSADIIAHTQVELQRALMQLFVLCAGTFTVILIPTTMRKVQFLYRLPHHIKLRTVVVENGITLKITIGIMEFALRVDMDVHTPEARQHVRVKPSVRDAEVLMAL